jgi:hypothetical protein
MPLFYVTGLSGTGKSAVLSELRARGYHARGVDEDGFAEWINNGSGLVDRMPEHDPDFDFHEWYRSHHWVLSARRIEQLSRVAARVGQPVFLCGVADRDDAVWHLFDKVVALVADLPTIERRIAGRENAFGQTAEEFADILCWYDGYEATYRELGAVIIDATRPLGEVVDQIVAVSIGQPEDRLDKANRGTVS